MAALEREGRPRWVFKWVPLTRIASSAVRLSGPVLGVTSLAVFVRGDVPVASLSCAN